jgi:CheY-like chemotaxis protein
MGAQPKFSDLEAALGVVVPIAIGGARQAMRVLVAEDHEIGLELTCMMVRRLGASVDAAQNGHEALLMIEAAAAEHRPFALVLMDFMMPVVDGIEATRRLRRAGYSAADMPVIALTACAEPREIGRFTAAGGQAYLSKPLSLEKLSAAFDAWLPGDSVHDTASRTPPGHALNQRYKLRKLATIERIEAAIRLNQADILTIAEIRELLHKLAGTAGMFGDDALSEIAAECENALIAAPHADAIEILRCNLPRLGDAA